MRAHVLADIESDLSPDQISAALLDFTERRPRLWPNLDGNYYEVHSVGESSAVVTEGNIGRPKLWAQEHYDWSQPGRIEWRSGESNYCKPGGGVVVTLTETPNGGSRLSMEWERESLNWRGRLAIAVVKIGGPRMFRFGMKRNLGHIAKVLEAERS